MTSSLILSSVTFIYGFAGVLYIFAWVFRKPAVGRLGTGAALIGLIGNAAGFILRWVESYQLGFGRAPLSNLYESLIFYALCITLVYLAVERRTANRVIGAFSMPLAFLAMAYASLSPNISDRIQPLIPALKSNWLIAHVVTCFLGYAAFAVAFGVSLMYIFKRQAEPSRGGQMPPVETLDELTHQLVVFGFLFLSAGIITGAVWANSAWGRYWGWDPKETWSLITWFIYAALLHARLTRGWRGRRIAYLSVLGFAAVLFTYFGVNLLPGLHSYQSTGP
ncbi:MAG: c-type cytochrome biogenesis protein CcsB [Desulfobacterales bacterium]|jgi:cytochrome c-type biogenesis protein CcsB|nr:c-type cytochrome biogenesis protein CcsB [Desulfobacterales bacterium]